MATAGQAIATLGLFRMVMKRPITDISLINRPYINLLKPRRRLERLELESKIEKHDNIVCAAVERLCRYYLSNTYWCKPLDAYEQDAYSVINHVIAYEDNIQVRIIREYPDYNRAYGEFLGTFT